MNAILSAAAAVALVVAGNPVWIGKFIGSGAPPAPWQVVQIDKKTKATTYRLATVAGVAAVEARANDSMALLAQPRRAPVQQTQELATGRDTYDKTKESYLGFVALASIKLWIPFVHVA